MEGIDSNKVRNHARWDYILFILVKVEACWLSEHQSQVAIPSAEEGGIRTKERDAGGFNGVFLFIRNKMNWSKQGSVKGD